jgi:uncharacterized membrane protein (UPF0127 family)
MKRPVVILLIISLVCIVVGALLLAHSFLWKPHNPPLPERQLTIGTSTFTVEVADTVTTRMKGLSNREILPEGRGMLFIFPSKAKYGFWMKDTYMDLDFIWIADGKVVDITRNVPAQPHMSAASLKTYYPSTTVDQVLEVGAGDAVTRATKVGDGVVLAL